MVVGFYFVYETYEMETRYVRVPLPYKVRVFITKLSKRSVRSEENRLRYTASILFGLHVNTSIQ